MREEFSLSGLERKDLDQDPVLQFEKWFLQAKESGMIEPNAMTLATVNPEWATFCQDGFAQVF